MRLSQFFLLATKNLTIGNYGFILRKSNIKWRVRGVKNMGNIHEKIIKLRDKFGLSPAELAKRSELDPSYISKLEDGAYKSLSIKVSKALAKGFGLTLKDFMDELGLFEEKNTPSFELITSALRRNGYTNDQTKQIVEYARFIKNQN